MTNESKIQTSITAIHDKYEVKLNALDFQQNISYKYVDWGHIHRISMKYIARKVLMNVWINKKNKSNSNAHACARAVYLSVWWFFSACIFFSSARASIRKSRLSIGNGKNWFEFSKHIEYIAFNADSVFQTDCRQIAIFLSTRGKVSAYPHRWLTLCVQIYGNSKYKSQQDFNIKYSFGLQSARSDLYYNR